MKKNYNWFQFSFLVVALNFCCANAENSEISQELQAQAIEENITLKQLIDCLTLAHENYLGEVIEQNYNKAKVNYLFVAEQERTGISRDALDIIKSAQNFLGLMYVFGKGSEVDLIKGDMWLTIASYSSNNKKLAEHMISSCEANMTKEEVSTAKELAREWRQAHELQ